MGALVGIQWSDLLESSVRYESHASAMRFTAAFGVRLQVAHAHARAALTQLPRGRPCRTCAGKGDIGHQPLPIAAHLYPRPCLG
jgi:hypothetical protein